MASLWFENKNLKRRYGLSAPTSKAESLKLLKRIRAWQDHNPHHRVRMHAALFQKRGRKMDGQALTIAPLSFFYIKHGLRLDGVTAIASGTAGHVGTIILTPPQCEARHSPPGDVLELRCFHTRCGTPANRVGLFQEAQKIVANANQTLIFNAENLEKPTVGFLISLGATPIPIAECNTTGARAFNQKPIQWYRVPGL
jgi:hypothetical protein